MISGGLAGLQFHLGTLNDGLCEICRSLEVDSESRNELISVLFSRHDSFLFFYFQLSTLL